MSADTGGKRGREGPLTFFTGSTGRIGLPPETRPLAENHRRPWNEVVSRSGDLGTGVVEGQRFGKGGVFTLTRSEKNVLFGCLLVLGGNSGVEGD